MTWSKSEVLLLLILVTLWIDILFVGAKALIR